METKLKTKKIREFLQYKFTHDEIHQKGSDIARIASELEGFKEEKKSAVAGFNANIASAEAEISTLGKHINNGYEYRHIDCTVTYNDPNSGIKTTRRNDTGEVVKKETMTSDEMQVEFEFD